MNFFQGIVEDNSSDPLKMGRIKIRIFGLHTESRTLDDFGNRYTVDELPWAYPAFPITSPTISQECGFGVPQQGSIVVGFFMDPEKQKPIYFATMPRIPVELPDFDTGFSDPDGVYPKADYLNESPISRLATGENIEDTIIQTKKDSVETADAGNGKTFTEPQTPYAATYPKNKVIQTESGHVLEIDDTPGATRIHVYHNSGSFEEFHHNGDKVDKVVKDGYEIILGSKNILIKGSEKIEIQGAKNIHVAGNTELVCDSTVNIDAAGDVNINGGSNDMSGVITQKCICPFHGHMHSDYSDDVTASK